MIFKKLRNSFSQVPLLGWLLGTLIAVILERYLGDGLADVLGLPKIPVLFGFLIMLKKPLLIPSAVCISARHLGSGLKYKYA